jgi:hypothetical protein
MPTLVTPKQENKRSRFWTEIRDELTRVSSRDVTRINDTIVLDAAAHSGLRGSMRKNKNQLKVIARSSSPQTSRTDTSGNPSESYHWGHMATVRREWQHQFRQPYVNAVNALEPTLFEITSTEMRVRTELYPPRNHQVNNSLASDRARRIA